MTYKSYTGFFMIGAHCSHGNKGGIFSQLLEHPISASLWPFGADKHNCDYGYNIKKGIGFANFGSRCDRDVYTGAFYCTLESTIAGQYWFNGAINCDYGMSMKNDTKHYNFGGASKNAEQVGLFDYHLYAPGAAYWNNGAKIKYNITPGISWGDLIIIHYPDRS